MKLSIVIICWNDLRVIADCLRSIISGTHSTDYEIIVSDNGSTDVSVAFIRQHYPTVFVLENHNNLGFAKGNNAGIRVTKGDYVLILNPDTIVHDGALDRWMRYADNHPEAGAFGCRVLNADGSYQESARPFPTPWRDWIAALYLRPFGYLSGLFTSDKYMKWKGDTERLVDWQSGCCILFRSHVLKSLGGFDERFFYHCEEVDLCKRLWDAGHTILFTPDVSITHLGGQSVGRYPIKFALETTRNRYRYYFKHFGRDGVRQIRSIEIAKLRLRLFGFRLRALVNKNDDLRNRIEMLRTCLRWNIQVNPVRFVEADEEPDITRELATHATFGSIARRD